VAENVAHIQGDMMDDQTTKTTPEPEGSGAEGSAAETSAPEPGSIGSDAPSTPPPPPPTTKFCFACGATIDARAELCPKCGVRQPWQAGMPGSSTAGNAVTRTGKTKLAASLLAIFLGWIGVHKFYLGDTGKGVLYLVFFWTGIPAIVGFIEGIIWLTQPDDVWLAKYGDR
jgi:TM2 domain-containing membrane protein YozV